MATIRFGGKAPRVHASVFVAESAVVVGDVEIGEESSLWFGAVVRGDVNFIRIGARTNVQDLGVVHVSGGTHPTVVGDDVTLGHRVTLHGCTVKDRSLVGIGAIVMDGAVVGEEAMVGAGASQGQAESRYYEIFVRFEDGGYETFGYQGAPPFRVGDLVSLTPQGLVRQ